MSNEQLDKIIDELNTVAKLIAVNVLKDKSPTEKISTLLDFGFETKTIANLLGTKENIVRAVKSKLAKAEKKTKSKTKTETAQKENVEKTSEN
jgi:predicted metallo-beta-lactamase superfamily hydrolase